MFMCVVNLKSVNKLDLTWKQSFLTIVFYFISGISFQVISPCFIPQPNGPPILVNLPSYIYPNIGMMGGMLAPTANSASPLVTSSASMEPRQNFPQPQPAPALPPNLLPVPVSLHPVTVADEPTNENISVKVKS